MSMFEEMHRYLSITKVDEKLAKKRENIIQ